jgi:thioredoxin 1
MKITDQNYMDVIDNNLVVIKMGTVNCGPCRVIDPIFKKLETEDCGVVIGLCDVDDNPDVAVAYGIRNVPTVLFLKDGEVREKHVGVISEAQLRAKIDAFKEG